MTQDKLLPCPFCGSENISAGEISTTDIAGEEVVQSVCMDCGACGPGTSLENGEVDYGDVKSISAWNRRPSIPQSKSLLSDEEIYAIRDKAYVALVDTGADTFLHICRAIESKVRQQDEEMRMCAELKEVIGFLLGENAIELQWFGDRSDGQAKYWWRKNLRDAIAKQKGDHQ